ncbi:RFC checkpoint protein Rad17 [Sporothrix epigloea]|uniref:RFC checkpoint protein Rad17 n=1 Tax=Sporothrix epigloea TaxID=1892477 RepID=A0ABP0DSJ4_9PEZI
MSDPCELESTSKRTYWTRRYVFSCNHSTMGHCSVKSPVTSATDRATAAVVPFLMPIRVQHVCVLCVRHQLTPQPGEKMRNVRARFTSLCHELDTLTQNLDKYRRSKSSRCPVDDEADKQIEWHEGWENQPLTPTSLFPLYRNGDASITSSEEDVQLCLSDEIRRLRMVLERCKRPLRGSTPSSDAASDNMAMETDSIDMISLADTSEEFE